ncbi:MAG: choice-of-anchor C family protein [Sedimentisphaerales bacterium]|nr:choice-of-anchor C family protein [Sedimentisphaerales bacterium]
MKEVLKVCSVLLVAAVLVAAAPVQADLVQNGSFEESTYSSPIGSYVTLYEGSTAITGWTVIGAVAVASDSVDYIGGYWQASEGNRSLDLNGYYGTGGVEQVISTVAGNTYVVTFDMAGNPDRQGVKTMEVSAGTQSALFQFDTTGHSKSNMGWETMTWSFIADAPDTTLRFMSTMTNPNDNAWGPALDNVHVTPIPAAVLLGMVGLGSSGGLLAWRKRRTLQ